MRTSRDGFSTSSMTRPWTGPQSGTGRLRDLTSKEIDRLDAGAWFHPRFRASESRAWNRSSNGSGGRRKVFFDVKDADLSQLLTLVHTGRPGERLLLLVRQ